MDVNKQMLAALQGYENIVRIVLNGLKRDYEERGLMIRKEFHDELLAALGVACEAVYAAKAIAAAEQKQKRCEYCDGTGDVHSPTGEWRGTCDCEAAQQAQQANFCVTCEGHPSAENNPCAVCGAQQAEPVLCDEEGWKSGGELWRSGISKQQAESVALPDFEDPAVKTVYALLCGEMSPPDGEHWEGWLARRIVQQLTAHPPAVAVPEGLPVALMQARYALRDFNNKQPGCGFDKLAMACEQAASIIAAAQKVGAE